MTNPAEYPRLTDEALVEIVETENDTYGHQALELLVDRNGVNKTAELLDCSVERVEEIL
jgi:hypothetical protein